MNRLLCRQLTAADSRSLSSQCVRLHLRVLRWCGFVRVRGGGGALQRAHAHYRAAVLALVTFYLAQECIYAYQVRDDLEKVSRVMYLLLCHVTSLVKQLVFLKRAARIEHMLDGLDEPLFNQTRGAHGRLLVEGALSARRLLKAYAGTAVLTCALWTTFPVLYHARAQPVLMPLWLYVDYNSSHTIFFMVMAYSFGVTALVGIANTTMDGFIAAILEQCKIQLRILRMNFEELPQRAAELARGRKDLTYNDVLMKIFLDCLQHYQKITETLKTLQNIFDTAIFIQFGVGGWILCLAAYQIVGLELLSLEFTSTVLFIVCILTELFLYCYYGNDVRDESERVVESIYSMEWSRVPLPLRRSLLLVMVRAKRPLRPVVGVAIPLSLDTFVKIIKSSYSFYAVLRQTK